MEVVLIEEVYKLGNPGDVVKVKKGYARNYLLPNKLAVNKTPHALKIVEKNKEVFAQKIVEKNKEYNEILEKLSSIESLESTMEASKEGKLFGSVSSLLISRLLEEKFQIKLDKKYIIIRNIIKIIGEHEVDVVFKPELKTKLKVIIHPKEN